MNSIALQGLLIRAAKRIDGVDREGGGRRMKEERLEGIIEQFRLMIVSAEAAELTSIVDDISGLRREKP